MDNTPMHTAGPWVTRITGLPEHNNEQWLVFSSDEYANEGDTLICEVNTLDGADARLIAAAPDLLEALRECNDILTRLTSGTPDPSGTDIIVHYEACVRAEMASRKAIAKATKPKEQSNG